VRLPRCCYPPGLDALMCIGQREELAGLDALGPDKRVEGSYEGIVGWRSWPGEVQFHTVQIGPRNRRRPVPLFAAHHIQSPQQAGDASPQPQPFPAPEPTAVPSPSGEEQAAAMALAGNGEPRRRSFRGSCHDRPALHEWFEMLGAARPHGAMRCVCNANVREFPHDLRGSNTRDGIKSLSDRASMTRCATAQNIRPD